MLLLTASLFFSSLVSVFGLSLVPATHLEQQPDQSTNEALQLLYSINQSSDPTNAATSQRLEVPRIYTACDGTLGRGLLTSSCTDAVRHVDASNIQHTWGPRGMGYSQPLPRAVSSTDGTCFIVVDLMPGNRFGTGTNENVAVGAAKIIWDCVNPLHIGGSARNTTGDDIVSTLIHKFNPDHVICYSAITAPAMESSCYDILENMPYDNHIRWFGPAGRGVNVVLPKTFTSRDGRCEMVIRTSGVRDHWAWDEFYYEGIAVVGMCIRTGKLGAAVRMGGFETLALEFRATGLSTNVTTS